MITQALVVAAPGQPFKLQDVQIDDDLRDNEVLVEIKATGVCHTDLNFSKEESMPGLFPAVLGHEGAGIVVRKGSQVTSVDTGDHVLLTYTSCGNCKYCHRKETSYCNDWFQYNFGIGRLDGSKTLKSKDGGEPITSHFFGQSSFARHAIVMETGLVKVDKKLPLDILAPMGCGVQTGAGAMLNVVKPSSDSVVVVVGAGAVGLSALMSLKTLPSPPEKVIAVDVVPQRLELAKSLGATHVVNSRESPDLKDALMKITEDQGVDGAIDTTGRPDVVNALLKSVAKKGIVVTVGVGSLAAEASANIFETVNSGRTYVGCAMGSCYPQEFIPMLIEAWQRGDFPLDKLIGTYPAEEMQVAVKEILDGKTVKGVLTWG